MDKLSRKILQNTMRFLSAKGYRVLSEFALPNKKRVDIIGINLNVHQNVVYCFIIS